MHMLINQCPTLFPLALVNCVTPENGETHAFSVQCSAGGWATGAGETVPQVTGSVARRLHLPQARRNSTGIGETKLKKQKKRERERAW